MELNSINVAVRVRPWHPTKELPHLSGTSHQPVFLGDGNFAASPMKAASGGIREVVEVMDHRQLDFDKPEPGSRARKGFPGARQYKDRRYVFDRVYNQEASQTMIFEQSVKPLLGGVLDGYNATVFAYGATGCGKTHTISGRPGDEGVIVRAMSHLFERFEEDRDTHDYYVELSFCEIYNETIRDLLSLDVTPKGGLKLLENEKDRVAIHQITLKRPKTVDEVMDLVMQGNERRSTSPTEANSESSRSHAILQINVGRVSKGTEVDMQKQVVRQCVTSATLSIIDLAGSERAAASKNSGARQIEGRNINKSLLALSSCITALCQRPTLRGAPTHVPYRDSKLTRLLKFSLGGNCRTVMIVCISPSSKDIDNTHNTLQWANRAKDVTTKVSKNTEGVALRTQQYLDRIATQEMRIKELEAEIAAGPRSVGNPAVEAKRLRERQEVQQALDGLDAEVESHEPTIDTGAEKRALWDVSELTAASLNRRIAELQANIDSKNAALVKRDLEYLEERVKAEEKAFRRNRIVHGIIHKESKSASTIENHIENIAGRSFDNLLEGDVERLKVALEYKRKEVDNKVFAARERGYRRKIAEHVNRDTTASLHIHSQKESLALLADALAAAGGTASQFASRIQDEIAKSSHVLDLLHGDLAPLTGLEAIPPAPNFKDLQSFGLQLPPTPAHRTPSSRFSSSAPPMSPIASPSPPLPSLAAGRAPRSRLSMIPRASPPSSSSSQSRFSLGPSGPSKPSPASSSSLGLPTLDESGLEALLPKNKLISRLQAIGKPASPRKRVSASPGKRRFGTAIKSALASAGQPRSGPAKTARWKGDDSITEEKTMSDAMTSSPEVNSGNDSGSTEWDDLEEKDSDPPLASIKEQVRTSMGPPVRKVTIAPVANVRLFSTSSESSASASMPAPPVPAPVVPSASHANDWKAARQRNVQAVFNLNTVTEEGGPSSPSSDSNTSLNSPFGAPGRSTKPSPLAESRQNSMAPPAASAAFSRLLKPTASSSARNLSISEAPVISVVDTSRMTRRESGIGPASVRPPRRSVAAAPYARKADLSSPSLGSINESYSAPSLPSGKSVSALAGGAKRLSINPGFMGDSSTRGPRESISTSSSLGHGAGGSLRSRASMANLSSFKQAGETSVILPRASTSNLRQSMAGGAEPPRWRG